MKNCFRSLVALSIGALVAAGCMNKEKPEMSDDLWEGCVIGFYPENGNETLAKGELFEVDDFEETIGKKVGSVVWFPTWDDEFPLAACQKMHQRGIIPHLTWEIFWPSEDPNNSRQTDGVYEGFEKLLKGEFDAYIEQFARDAKSLNEIVLIRFMHEFNGNWYVWSGNKNGGPNGGPEKVVEVWQYVVDKFRSEGADNVKWLWVPHGPSTDRSEEAWNNVSNYWPGSDYVDWIGLDAYNFYPQDPWGGKRPFRDFDNCFRALYDSCAKLGDHPMMIAEFGTGEFNYEGIDKAAWITDAFTKIKTEYTRVKIFTWFNINKELDWRVNSSPESLKAFREAMEDPYYIGSPFK